MFRISVVYLRVHASWQYCSQRFINVGIEKLEQIYWIRETDSKSACFGIQFSLLLPQTVEDSEIFKRERQYVSSVVIYRKCT